MGLGDLRSGIQALASAKAWQQAEGRLREIFVEIEVARDKTPGGARERMLALAALTRSAAEEYPGAAQDGGVRDLEEYQEAWGALQSVQVEAQRLSKSEDAKVSDAARRVLEQVDVALQAFRQRASGRQFPLGF